MVKNKKKIDIDVPKLKDFVHKIYTNVARKVYTNVYLFEKEIQPLEIQKNNRELELIVKECILNSVRESVPVEHILRSYLDETEEETVEEELVEPVMQLKTDDNLSISNEVIDMKLDIKNVEDKVKSPTPLPSPSPVKVEPKPASPVKIETKPASPVKIETKPASPVKIETKPASPVKIETKPASPVKVETKPVKTETTSFSNPSSPGPTLGKAIKFSNFDKELSVDNTETVKTVPKTIANLEQISNVRHEQRKLEEEEEDDDDTLKIMDDVDINIDVLDINSL